MECRKFEFRRNLKTGGRTEVIVVKGGKILAPTRIERSRTYSHGTDIYCLQDWSDTIIVKLYRSNSGKLSYEIESPSEEIKRKLKNILETVSDFDEALDAVRMLFKSLPKLK